VDQAHEIQPEDEILREEMADRFRRVAGGMTERVLAVPADRWDDPAPCDGWVARDVVDHLTEWLPAFYCGSFAVLIPRLRSASEDPVGAWIDLRDFLQASIDDPDVAFRTGNTPLDERLDADEVHRQVAHLEDMPFDAMVASGHYGARVEVPAEADDQTRLLAALGRNP
jgi:hypothetical protein